MRRRGREQRVRECVCAAVEWSELRRCRVTPGVFVPYAALMREVRMSPLRAAAACRAAARAAADRASARCARRAERRAAPDSAALPACCGLISRCVDARSAHVAASGGGRVPSRRTCGGRPSERAVRARALCAERREASDGAALTACCGTCRCCPLSRHRRPCPRPSPRKLEADGGGDGALSVCRSLCGCLARDAGG